MRLSNGTILYRRSIAILSATFIYLIINREAYLYRANTNVEDIREHIEVHSGVVGSPLRHVESSPICEPFVTRSTTSIWADNVDHILMATQPPKDVEYTAHDFVAELLRLVSTRLPSSAKLVSKDHGKTERVLKKAYRRYEYLQKRRRLSTHGESIQKLPPEPNTVKILVLGGSVTRGSHCTDFMDLNITEEECAWPARLESFINNLAQGPLVNVYNMARGSTNSVVGNMIVKHGMIPLEAKYPDIVILSYATNDQAMFTPEERFDSLQELVRSVLTMSECRRPEYQPIVFHLDDWVGGGHKIKLMKDILAPARDGNLLASYYGFALASFSEVARDFVLGDTREYYFTSKEWYDENGTMQIVDHQAVHPGPGMHIVTAWVIAYNLLHHATTYCGFEAWTKSKVPAKQREASAHDYDNVRIPGMPDVRTYKNEEPGKPLPIPRTIPPPISNSITLEDISETWRNQTGAGCAGAVKCPFLWWWADYGYTKPLEKDERIESLYAAFRPHVEHLGGWRPVEEHAKVGWMPGSAGGRLLLKFEGMAQPNGEVTVFYIRSYGPEWQSSALVQLSTRARRRGAQWIIRAETVLQGLHDKHTSEVYVETMRLPPTVIPGSDLRFSLRLTDGEKFKLMGLSVCAQKK